MMIVKLLLTSAAVRREREAQWRSLRINRLAQSSAGSDTTAQAASGNCPTRTRGRYPCGSPDAASSASSQHRI